MKIVMKVKIDSEAIFNSGESDQNTVQMASLADEYGFVYFHSKTLKGQLKEQAFWICKEYFKIDKNQGYKFLNIVSYLFGLNDDEFEYHFSGEKKDDKFYRVGALKFSNLQLDAETKDYFKDYFQKDENDGYYRITKQDILKAQTNIRTNIRLKDGIVETGGIVNFHTVKKGLTFYSELELVDNKVQESNISQDELFQALKLIASGFRRIGASTHRGRGEISTELL